MKRIAGYTLTANQRGDVVLKCRLECGHRRTVVVWPLHGKSRAPWPQHRLKCRACEGRPRNNLDTPPVGI